MTTSRESRNQMKETLPGIHEKLEKLVELHSFLQHDRSDPVALAAHRAARAALGRLGDALEILEGRQLPQDNPAPFENGSEDEDTVPALTPMGIINISLKRRATDEIPEGMSQVIGEWLRGIQETFPSTLTHNPRWREILPFAAETDNKQEKERGQLVTDWIWETVLPYLQPMADRDGYGKEWRAMSKEKNNQVAHAASRAAKEAAEKPGSAPLLACAAKDASDAAKYAAMAGIHQVCDSHQVSAQLGARTARITVNTLITEDALPPELLGCPENTTAATNEAKALAWKTLDPIGLLEKLIAI